MLVSACCNTVGGTTASSFIYLFVCSCIFILQYANSPICPFVFFISTRLVISPSFFNFFIYFCYLVANAFAHLTICSPNCLSIGSSVHSTIHSLEHLLNRPCADPTVCPFDHSFIWPSAHPNACLLNCLTIFLVQPLAGAADEARCTVCACNVFVGLGTVPVATIGIA